MLESGERQVAPTLDGIRRDHVARYEWAVRILPPGSRVIDLACGVGYGAKILAEAGHAVLAIDNDPDAIAYAGRHYHHPLVTRLVADASSFSMPVGTQVAAAICFETIEHLEDPRPMLRALREAAPVLLASVPNETHFPFKNYKFHHRHYTRPEFAALLAETGWELVEVMGQRGPQSEVGPHSGRTLIVHARRAAAIMKPERKEHPVLQKTSAPTPAHVAILGLGPSLATYIEHVKCAGGRGTMFDEVWAINALGDVLACDRIFHMDDVAVQEVRAAADPDGMVASMLVWLKKHPGPIYTSVVRAGYPGCVAFPLEDVINHLGYDYFNSTAAYAVAYAVHLGVEKISMFGCDFSYAHSHQAEKGRACVEFWLGYAAAKGIRLGTSGHSSLLDGIEPKATRLYGYDAVEVSIEPQPDGLAKVRMTPRASLPSAAEIERRYDHSRPSVHPHLLKQSA